MENIYLAIDIGASSGRHMIITKQDDIFLDEVYRFEHGFYQKDGHLFWSYKNLFEEVKRGIKMAIRKYPKLKSIGIDTWGVDYTYIDKTGKIIRDPISYRDDRGKFIKEELNQFINDEDLYRKTGIQYMHFNTIYQMYHDTIYFKKDINKAYKMLMIPDLIGYYLTQQIALEYTNFSTSNLMHIDTHAPIDEIQKLSISKSLFPSIVKPGNLLGYLDIFAPEELKHKKIKVFNVCAHDTASAYASIKKEKGTAILNVGTWSLLGTIIDKPVISEKSKMNNFTNEAGIEGIRFLKNIMGMWIMNQLKQQWESEGQKLTFKILEKKALLSTPYKCFIDPDDPIFNQKDHMQENIQNYCRKTNQEVPESIGETTRCIYESLAFKYRYVLEKLETTIGYPIHKIIILGGGAQSKMLSELTAKITQRAIFIGPIEATVLGNSVVQMLANGDINHINEAQDSIAKHFLKVKQQTVEAKDLNAYKRFLKLIDGEN